MTLFVDEGAVYPDFWALLHGEMRIAGVRLLKPTLLLEPPAGTTPDADATAAILHTTATC